MLVRLSGCLRDSSCSDVLARWMSSSPRIRARFLEAMDHVSLPAVHKKGAGHLYVCGGPLFRTLCERAPFGVGCTSVWLPCVVSVHHQPRRRLQRSHWAALPTPRPTRDHFDAMWKSLTAPLALSPQWNVPTPRRRVVIGPHGRGHNTCNPGHPCASPLTGHVPSPLWCGVTGTRAPVGVGHSYRLV